MNRKDFLRSSCQLCLLGAAGALMPAMLSSCGTTKAVTAKYPVVDNKIQVPLKALTAGHSTIIRPEGWDFEVAIHKSGDAYQALLLQCTHFPNPLTPTGGGAGYYCTHHGSQFDEEGKVRKGPAGRPLKQYRTEVQNDNLIIFT